MKRNNIKKIIRDFFFINPTVTLRVREIERKLRVPLPSVIKYCKELEKEEILKVVRVGSVTFYAARRDERYFLEKMLFNVRLIYDSGIIEYLKQEFQNPPIVLFGSFAKGEDVEESDIDFYIEISSMKKLDLKRFNKYLRRDVELFCYKNLKEISNVHLANNIINGITLNNYIEVFR